MPPIPVRIPESFQKELAKKEPSLAGAIVECTVRLGENTRGQGLQTHPVRGYRGVFEAYVDRKNRVTFHYGDGEIVMRKHCNHDILKNP
ncbi:MAG TPA: hypothetical protein VIM33_08745 [Gaiellaceae bacterium]